MEHWAWSGTYSGGVLGAVMISGDEGSMLDVA